MILIMADNPKTCVAASLAMVLELPYDQVVRELGMDSFYFPFEPPWHECPLVPDMTAVCDWAFRTHHAAFVPFEKNPVCTPHLDCKPVPVWYNRDSEAIWRSQLKFGDGLIECQRHDGMGHMVAWDCARKRVLDPEGYDYPHAALGIHGLEERRFWLCT